MDIAIHNDGKIAELISSDILITGPEDGLAQVVIIGEFSKYPGKSIRDLIYESNKGRQVNFLDSLEAAVARLSV